MRRTINADGELVEVGSNETATAPLLSNSGTIDFFGFNLEWRQFLIALVLASLMLGIQGGKRLTRNVSYNFLSIHSISHALLVYLYTYVGMALLIVLGAYTAFTRTTATAQGASSSSESRGSNSNSSTNRWTRPTGGGNTRGGGSNIRGISDLPCDPKRG